MFHSLAKRFFQLVFVLWGISTIIFFMERLIPGSPADAILGPDAADIDKIAWLARYGLNKPLVEQYFTFLTHLVKGDLGKSYATFSNVTDIILPRLFETLRLASTAFIFSLLVAIPFGIIGAANKGKLIDKGLAIASLFAISAPSFIMGPILMWIFSVELNIFPLMGNLNLSSFVLPTVTLGSSLAAFSSRMIRSGLVDVLQEDYIRTAKSKGMQLGVLLSGTIITEQIFNWPGLGGLILESVQQREYNIISGCVILMATIYVLCNLAVDILYRIFDPRVKYS